MSQDDSFIRRELASAKYRYQDQTRKSILEVVQQYKGLKVVTEDFVFNNGVKRLLVVLKGTIPIMYKGSTYHIPVAIYLLDTHPYNAPMVFVKPTADMRIKISRHVDHTGKVYLPYLHDWKHDTSDLMCLIQVLIMTFGEQPPVYSVPPHMQQQQPVAAPYPAQPYPPAYPGSTPYPVSGAMPMPMPTPVSQPPPTPQSQGGMSFSFRPSLLSAAEEKVKRRLDDVYLSLEIIKSTGKQLNDGQEKLNTMMSKLAEEKTVLERNIETCQKECDALDEKIKNSTNEEGNANIDDAIQAPTPLYRQILNTVAEEASLEDTIYYLGEALRREQIGLDEYFRTVRQLSRRQYMQRAILRKCRQKAGFAG